MPAAAPNWNVPVVPDPAAVERMVALRRRVHADNSSPRLDPSRPDDEERKGAKGEVAFGQVFGLECDWTPRKYGDGGIDFEIVVNGASWVLDVKAQTDPRELKVKESSLLKPCDIYVLAYINPRGVLFLGWEHQGRLKSDQCEWKQNRFGGYNKVQPASRLNRMDRLWDLVSRRTEQIIP